MKTGWIILSVIVGAVIVGVTVKAVASKKWIPMNDEAPEVE